MAPDRRFSVGLLEDFMIWKSSRAWLTTDRLFDVEAELEIRDGEDIKPVHISTARSVPKYFKAAADELVCDLLAANIIEEVQHATTWT